MRCLLILLLFGGGLALRAQNDRLDSLRTAIGQSRPGAERGWSIIQYLSTLQSYGRFDSTEVWAREAVDIGRKNELDSLTARGYCSLFNYAFAVTETGVEQAADSALVYLRRAGDFGREAQLRGVLGYWLSDQFLCDEALRQLHLADSINQRLDLSPADEVRTLTRHVMSLLACEQDELALSYFPRIYGSASQLRYKDKLNNAYKMTAGIHLRNQRIDSARHYLSLMKTLLPELKKEVAKISQVSLEAKIALAEGNYAEAYGLATEARQRYWAANDSAAYLIAPLQLSIGNAAYQMGRFRESRDLLLEAASYFKDYGKGKKLAETYAHLGNAYAGMGQMAAAADYHRLSRAVSDSIQMVRHQVQLERIMTEFETEKIKRALLESDQNRMSAEQAAARYRMIGLGALTSLLLLACLGIIFYYRRRSQQLKSEKQRSELRYALLRAQMNPHFIFNSLNAIQSFFSNQRFSKGNEYLTTFSSLVRRILEQTAQPAIPLSEELETLEMYLELEQLRMGDRLSYRIQIDPEVETDLCTVPPLVFQPFVENAIWHGIAPKEGRGMISVHVEYADGDRALLAIIEDDGVGLSAEQQTDHVSQGVEITRRRLGPGGEVILEDKNGPVGERGVRIAIKIPLQDVLA